MRFSGYHFLMVGTVLAAGSALLFAKAYLVPSFREEAAKGWWGSNPFLLRNAITQRREAGAGAIWLLGSLVAALMGTQLTAQGGEMRYFIGSWLDALVLVGAGLVAWFVTLAITTKLSRRAYLPRMVEIEREVFEKASSAITHDGCLEHEVLNVVNVYAETREERLALARRSLTLIGQLTDTPRKAGETDREYVERLRPFFQPGCKSLPHQKM